MAPEFSPEFTGDDAGELTGEDGGGFSREFYDSTGDLPPDAPLVSRTSDGPFLACRHCGAAVALEAVAQHNRWHASLTVLLQSVLDQSVKHANALVDRQNKLARQVREAFARSGARL